MERNRYADLLRVVATGGVVYGHWLLASVTYRNGQLYGGNALDYVSWGREMRPAWFALLTAVLVPLVMLLQWAQRPVLRLPAGLGPPGPWSPVLLLIGLAASMYGLARLAIGGFAADGRLPVLVLAACAAGLGATLLTGRAPPRKALDRARSARRRRPGVA